MDNKVYRSRRKILLAGAAALPLTAWGQAVDINRLLQQSQGQGQAQAQQEPYRRVGPNPQDAGKIWVMISFTCPYCRQKYDFFADWIRNIPQPIEAGFLPVIPHSGDGSLMSLMAWEVVKRLPNEAARTRLLKTAWSYFIDKRAALDNAQAWRQVFQAAGVPWNVLNEVGKSIEPEAAAEYYNFAVRNEVIATPSVVFDGKLLVLPGHTSGNDDLFLQLLNGLASAMLENRLPV